MLVTVLYRFAKATSKEKTVFNDVNESMYYYTPIAWAAKNEYVNGTGDNSFNPDAYITRQDLATIIYRYLKKNGKGFEDDWAFNLEFSDKNLIKEYAIEPVSFLTANQVVSGKEGNKFDPEGFATRAEVAKIIERISNLTSFGIVEN